MADQQNQGSPAPPILGKIMPKPATPPDGFLTIARTWGAQVRRVLAEVIIAAGVACEFVVENEADITAAWPHPPHWVGGALVLIGFVARVWQKVGDGRSLTPANYTPGGQAAPVE